MLAVIISFRISSLSSLPSFFLSFEGGLLLVRLAFETAVKDSASAYKYNSSANGKRKADGRMVNRERV